MGKRLAAFLLVLFSVPGLSASESQEEGKRAGDLIKVVITPAVLRNVSSDIGDMFGDSLKAAFTAKKRPFIVVADQKEVEERLKEEYRDVACRNDTCPTAGRFWKADKTIIPFIGLLGGRYYLIVKVITHPNQRQEGGRIEYAAFTQARSYELGSASRMNSIAAELVDQIVSAYRGRGEDEP